MEKKYIIARIAVIIFSITILCLSFAYAQSPEDIREQTQDLSWYSNNLPSIVGQGIANSGVAYDRKGAYCIDDHLGIVYTGGWTVDCVIDINNSEVDGEGKVIVHTKNGDYTYDMSEGGTNQGVSQALKLGYLAKLATERGETYINVYGGGTAGSAKFGMAVMFCTKSIVDDLRTIHIGEDMTTKGKYQGVAGGSGAGIIQANKDLDAAAKAATNESKTVHLNDTTLNLDEVKIKVLNGKTYLGPYMIGYDNCTPSKIEVVTDSKTIPTTKIVYKNNQEANIKDVEKNKEFYIVIDGEINDTINRITVETKDIKTYKSRIVLLDGEVNEEGIKENQNFIIYRGDEEKKEGTSCELPLPGSVEIEIQKYDVYRDEALNFKGVGFKIYCVDKGWLQEEENKVVLKNTFDEAKTYYTDEKGKATVPYKLPVGKYSIYETEIPEHLSTIYELDEIKVPRKNGGADVKKAIENDDYKELYISKDQKALINVVNERAFSELQIEKYDENSGKKLENIGFKIYSVDQNGWVVADENNVAVSPCTLNFSDATEFKTGVAGEKLGKTAVIKKLKLGKYKIYETSLGSYSSYYSLNETTVNGQTVKATYKADVELIPNKIGEPLIVQIKNSQSNIKISGFVWEDQVVRERLIDNTYHDNDKRIEGITVKLKNAQTGNYIQETKTNEKGEYSFENVSVSDLDNLVVVFEYDGVLYHNVITNFKKDYEGAENPLLQPYFCKAVDNKDSREKLNNKFNELTGEGQVVDGIKLSYDKQTTAEDGNKVKLNNMATREEIDEKHVKVKENEEGFLVYAETIVDEQSEKSVLRECYEKLSQGGIVNEITDINLGLYIEMPNITLKKDIYQAEFNVNDQQYVQTYNLKLADRKNFNVDSTSNNFYYELPLYRADVDKTEGVYVWYMIKLKNETSNLYTQIHSIRERFSDAYSIEYDEDGPVIYVGNNISAETSLRDNLKEGKISSNDIERANVEIEQNEDTILHFKDPIKLSNYEKDEYTKYVYVLLKIEDFATYYNSVMDTSEAEYKDTSSGLLNFAEIGSYSVYSDENYENHYASVDTTSIPSNYDFNNRTLSEVYESNEWKNGNYEDDESMAHALILKDKGDRKMIGKVFEDLPENINADELNTGKERLGNGKLDEGEKGIGGVRVELWRVDEKDENGNIISEELYDSTTSSTEEENLGEYSFVGFQPNDYRIKFVWGKDNGGKDVKDYKGTIYIPEETGEDTENSAQERLVMSRDEEVSQEERLSDATDDYELRLAIDKDNLGKSDELYDEDTIKKYEKDDLKQMVSSTEVFNIGVDKKEIISEGKDVDYSQITEFFYYIRDGKTFIETWEDDETWKNWNMDVNKPMTVYIGWNSYDTKVITLDNPETADVINYTDLNAVPGPGPHYWVVIDQVVQGIRKEEIWGIDMPAVSNYEEREVTTPAEDFCVIDFGIIERPRQALEIYNDLTQVQVTTTQGQPVANALLKDDGLEVLSGQGYISGGKDLEYVWIQLDKSITQAMTAKMRYNVQVKNTSELDYDSEDYYKYGKISGNVIKLGAQGVYDYIEGSSLSTDNQYEKWSTQNAKEYNDDNSLEESKTTLVEKKYLNNEAYDNESKIFTEWQELIEGIRNSEITNEEKLRTVKLDNKEIVKAQNENEIGNLLEPGESSKVEIITSKLLANGDDIRFENDSEIAKTQYDINSRTGRALIKNLTQSYDRAEWVSITPSTGDDRDYTTIIVTSISAIAVLGIGIFIIKKKVL